MDLTIQENKVFIGTVYNYTSINLYIFVKKTEMHQSFKNYAFNIKYTARKW